MKLDMKLSIGLATTLVAVMATGSAMAATTTGMPELSTIKPTAAYACESSGHVVVTLLSTPSAHCPAGTTSIVLGAQGPRGTAGTPGAKGDTGSSGVIDKLSKTFDPIASVVTGGGFVANSTEVGTIDLPAGTYLISLNAKARPVTPTDGTQVFPQFFVYSEAKNADFTGDLFNVGSGALEAGTHTTIDSYYSGSNTVTLSGATTLHVYAFGYDSDTGVGTYNLENLTVNAVQLNAA